VWCEGETACDKANFTLKPETIEPLPLAMEAFIWRTRSIQRVHKDKPNYGIYPINGERMVCFEPFAHKEAI
jgi:hypothetical protein